MIYKKIIIGVFLLFFLSGCAQNGALLGPAYTLASTGNIYHAGLSYGSNKAIKKITGKSPTENIKSLTDNKKSKNEDDLDWVTDLPWYKKDQQNYDKFFALVKNRIENTSKIINSANQ
tara:strand:+ start:232 stop:585 length:354 start_codon:yes stop_codon:yes gene_type:complete